MSVDFVIRSSTWMYCDPVVNSKLHVKNMYKKSSRLMNNILKYIEYSNN